MAYEQRDNSGSLFKNDKKETDNHPDYKGSGMVGGTEVWLDAWVKVAATGTKYMSVSFKPKEQQAAKPAARQAAKPEPEFDDDMPF